MDGTVAECLAARAVEEAILRVAALEGGALEDGMLLLDEDMVPARPGEEAAAAEDAPEEEEEEGEPKFRRGPRWPQADRAATARMSELVGSDVEVPGEHWGVAGGVFFVGRVFKSEWRGQAGAEMRFAIDNTRCWFPASSVRQWVADMVTRGTWGA